jgi:CheY-like chemotaxis protein
MRAKPTSESAKEAFQLALPAIMDQEVVATARIRLSGPKGASNASLTSSPESGPSSGLKRAPISLIHKGGASLSSPTILLADDNEDDTKLVSAVLKRVDLPYHLEVVRDGDQALAYLKGEGIFADRGRYPLPVLLLLDLKMPGVSGFEVLQWIRNERQLDRLLVVVLTGSTRSTDMEKAFHLGANAYVVKSPKFDDLLSLLNSFDLLN